MSKMTVLATALLLASGAAAVAAPSHSQIEGREARQQGSIEEGRETGAITWREGLKLRAEQRRIRQLEAAYEADGHLSRTERSNLSALQDQARNHIVHEKADGWHRPWWLPRFGR